VGRTVTLLVGTVLAPPEPHGQQIGGVPAARTMQLQHAAVNTVYEQDDGAAIPVGPVVGAVQQDSWEQPHNGQASPQVAHELVVGDRITIRQGRRPIPTILGQIGTVVEIFRAPRDSCLVRIDGDRVRPREWFCYHDEVALATA
jgi:hypothetical protein